jgi:non-specific serine/threonine protein kinase
MRYFGAAGLADLLDDRFRVLVSNIRDRPARHQTLRAAVAWSYDLLSLAERRLFRALTVFEGGFVLDAAQRVNDEALQLLPDLVDRSLVVVEAGPRGTRYRVLETLREYGRAQLEPDEAAQVRLRHLLWALDLAEVTVPMVPGPGYAEALEVLDAERDNLWAALWWALRHGRREEALRLSTSLTLYWDERACFDEGLAVLREALASGTDLPAPLRSAAYSAGARLALGRADHDAATELARRSLQLAQECGHEPSRWRAQELLGMTALYQGDYQSALRLLDECRAEYERLGLASDHACVVGRLGQVHRLRGDFPAARATLEECLALRERVGDVNGRAWTLWQLGVVARYEGGRSQLAARLCRDALAAFEAVGDAGGAAHVRYSLGDLARVEGDRSSATELYEASLAVLRTHGDRRCVASVHYNLGLLALSDSPAGAAERHLQRSLEIRRDLNDRAGVAQCLEALAVLAEREDELVAAVRLLAEGAEIRALTGAASPVDEERTRSALVSSLRQRLGSTTFDSLWPAVETC